MRATHDAPRRRRTPCHRRARWTVAACVLALLPAARVAAQALPPSPYSARTIVTGMDPRSRPEGLARCLRDVLVAASGNPAWLDDPRVDRLAPDPAALLQDLAYLDRMSDQPRHDEQGTRDRPYDLIAWFDPARIDALLAQLGDRPWKGERPALAVQVQVVSRGGAAFPLLADGDPDERFRGALLAAAARAGMRVSLPRADGGLPGGVPVTGTLRWSDAEYGWVGEWTMDRDGPQRWRVAGVSYDEAFRSLVRGAAQLLSGHGPPGG